MHSFQHTQSKHLTQVLQDNNLMITEQEIKQSVEQTHKHHSGGKPQSCHHPPTYRKNAVVSEAIPVGDRVSRLPGRYGSLELQHCVPCYIFFSASLRPVSKTAPTQTANCGVRLLRHWIRRCRSWRFLHCERLHKICMHGRWWWRWTA